jgi:hypothetical protein
MAEQVGAVGIKTHLFAVLCADICVFSVFD